MMRAIGQPGRSRSRWTLLEQLGHSWLSCDRDAWIHSGKHARMIAHEVARAEAAWPPCAGVPERGAAQTRPGRTAAGVRGHAVGEAGRGVVQTRQRDGHAGAAAAAGVGDGGRMSLDTVHGGRATFRHSATFCRSCGQAVYPLAGASLPWHSRLGSWT